MGAKKKWDLPEHILNATYAMLVDCQIRGMVRLSLPACLYRQAKTTHPGLNYDDSKSMHIQLTRSMCTECDNELSEKDRKALQEAIKHGFRFEGRDLVRNREWKIKEGDKQTGSFLAEKRRMGFAAHTWGSM